MNCGEMTIIKTVFREPAVFKMQIEQLNKQVKHLILKRSELVDKIEKSQKISSSSGEIPSFKPEDVYTNIREIALEFKNTTLSILNLWENNDLNQSVTSHCFELLNEIVEHSLIIIEQPNYKQQYPQVILRGHSHGNMKGKDLYV